MCVWVCAHYYRIVSLLRVTALTERAKKLGRTVSFVELLTRSHPLNAEQINDLVYNPEHYTKTHPLLDEYKVSAVCVCVCVCVCVGGGGGLCTTVSDTRRGSLSRN